MSEHSQLLDILQTDDRNLLTPRLTHVRLETGRILTQPGEVADFCHFPCGGALASYVVVLDNGEAVETLMVGREGVIGGIAGMGAIPAYTRSEVVNGGCFYRIPVRELDHAKDLSPKLRALFSGYADCLMAQVFQSNACNAVHSIEQRGAKWLIASVERMGCQEVRMTQEQLASMMGIGRSYASRVVQRFKSEGIVRTRRGGITIVDMEKLVRRACACNEQVGRHYVSVFSGLYA